MEKINVDVYDYCLTWFEGEWSTWQIFRNKPGQANTNSNIESFNNTIKLDLSRKRLPMKAAIKAIFEQIVYYSTEYEPFAKIPKYNQKTRELADCLTKSNFRVVRPNKKIVYTGSFKGKESTTPVGENVPWGLWTPMDPLWPRRTHYGPDGPRRTPDGPRRPFASKMKKIAIWFIFILISSNFDLKHFVLLVLRLNIYYIIL